VFWEFLLKNGGIRSLKEKLPCTYSLTRAKVENEMFPIKLKDFRRVQKFVKSEY